MRQELDGGWWTESVVVSCCYHLGHFSRWASLSQLPGTARCGARIEGSLLPSLQNCPDSASGEVVALSTGAFVLEESFLH